MLKRRIIPIELYDSGRLFKTIQFDSRRDVGDPVKSSQVYSDQGADELLFLNISRESRDVAEMLPVIADIAKTCFAPLAVGGGIKSSEDASRLFLAGADKVVVNSSAYQQSSPIGDIARKHGKQAIVVSIDVRKTTDGYYKLYSDCGRCEQEVSLEAHIDNVIRAGAGEIMIQSIDRDGTMTGYETDLVSLLISQSTVPVIIAGGAGHFMDLKSALVAGADAVACGSLFYFGDNNPLRAKSFLKNHDIPLKVV